MGCPLKSTRIGHPGGTRRPRPAKVSILIAGIIVVLAIIIVASYGGPGGGLVFLAAATALAGLYILATGQRHWARVLRGRKVAAVVLAASLVLFIAGMLSFPLMDVADPSTASHGNHGARMSASCDPPNRHRWTLSRSLRHRRRHDQSKRRWKVDPHPPHRHRHPGGQRSPQTSPVLRTRSIPARP